MDDSEIDALAKGMVPFVRECVAEAYTRTIVPPELAEQIKSAIHLLHAIPRRACTAEHEAATPILDVAHRDAGRLGRVHALAMSSTR